MGLPRRVFVTGYAGTPQAEQWEGRTLTSVLGGVILFVSAMLFVGVIAHTLCFGRRTRCARLVWADSLSMPGDGFRPAIWDRLGMWWAIALVLVIVAYAMPLWDILNLERFGSPACKPF